MKSLRSKIIKSIPHSSYDDFQQSKENNKSINLSLLNTTHKKNDKTGDDGLSDLERENDKNLLEAKKLIQQTKEIIQSTNNTITFNKSFDSNIKTSQGRYTNTEKTVKINHDNFSFDDGKKNRLEESQRYSST